MALDAQGSADEAGTSDESMYAEYLEKFPEDQRATAEAVFKEWDGQVTKKFQGIREEYTPYKQLVDSYEPNYLEAGVRILEQLESDPQRVIELIQTSYGLTKKEAQEVAKEVQKESRSSSNGQAQIPQELQEQIARQQELIDGLYQSYAQQQESQQEAQQLAEFEDLLVKLQDKHGEYNMEYVLGLVAAGVEPEAAVKQFHKFVGEVRSGGPRPQAPNVLGGQGGIPAETVNYGLLSSKDRQDLVAQLLAQSQSG